MKKQSIFLMLFVIAVSLFSFQCKDKESGVTVAGIEGVVSYDGSAKADGAIVSLSTSPNAAAVISRVVADANGKYSFVGITAGTYYLSAKLNTANENNLKSGDAFMFVTATDVELKVSGSAVISQNLELVGNASTGTGIIDLANGWVWDNTHSTITFEFPYDAANAVFRGNFADVAFTNTAGTDLTMFKFDEANPANTKFTARCNLTSVETGSPSPEGGHGRDGITGCIHGTFGVELNPADTTATGYPNPTAISNPTGYAYLTSKTVSVYGDGYKAICDFTFHGATHEVTLYFHYIQGYEKANTSGAMVSYSSVEGWFEFAALADYGIESGHVGDSMVTVMVSGQFNKTATK